MLWVVNPTRETQRSTVTLASRYGMLRFGETHWAAESARFRDGEVVLPPRDALVVRLVQLQIGVL
jgi:hypothetical protein